MCENGDSAWIYTDNSRDALLPGSADDPNQFGWNTNAQSMGLALTTLRKFLHTKQIVIPSRITYEELAGYNWDKREGAEHDDTIAALAIGLQVMSWVTPEQMEKQSFDEWYEEKLMQLVNYKEDGHGEITNGFIPESAFGTISI